ncbi:MAG: glycerol-3-phosphate dehydrogenase/oxidase [Candidatus Dadabacteria bacterium]|nr:glycerol-3-phosphate dehydrogenase/oxidase [Candidatus Dadabacteria bacterium]
MKRQLEQLSDKEYDILVIGGGIFGLFIAWDGALRGLSVALIDKGDFGGATSSNSLRIIHGGFRHLQSLDLWNSRRSIKEQRIFMKLAPHLVSPMPVIIPMYSNNFLKNKSFAAAVRVYDLLGIGLGESKQSGLEKFNNRVISREECIKMIPDIEKNNLSGGILFTDCQLSNSERLSIQVASSAFKEGAHLANYVEALSLIIKDNKVKGAAVRDNLTGDEFEIRARVTVNSTGPWLNHLLSRLDNDYSVEGYGILKAFNVLINRDLTNGYALGLNSQINSPEKANLLSKSSRYLFITPWNGKSLIGTEYLLSNLDPDNFKVTREEISSFLDDINTSYPAVSLKTDDVEFVYGGFVPTYLDRNGKAKIGIKNHIHDHEKEQGLSGLFSATGNKYTEARIVAQKTVDLVIRKMGKTLRPSNAESTTLNCNKFDELEDYLNREIDKNKGLLHPSQTRKLIYTYGAAYGGVLKYIDRSKAGHLNNIDNDSLIKSQIIYAIKEEMAQKLTDVIFRRTNLGLNFENLQNNLTQYSRIMAKELNWDDSRIKMEEDEVISRFKIFN